ncbi:hypothetical protein [uncultured Jatrophihabitans sp.]|uniref:hypothetical protein n=1 Tax=uncultured Jatrophihabitans sp. TaxID=1610747 RepID=UPI0035C97554
MADDPGAVVDALLDRLVTVLSGTAGDAPSTTGTAADDQIVAVLRRGRVESLSLDPRVLRDRGRVAADIVTAVNAAMDAAPRVGTGSSIVESLKAIQEDSLQVTGQLNGSLLASLERIRGA